MASFVQTSKGDPYLHTYLISKHHTSLSGDRTKENLADRFEGKSDGRFRGKRDKTMDMTTIILYKTTTYIIDVTSRREIALAVDKRLG